MDPGKRDQLITFERATVTVDDYGGETPDWDEFAQAWVQVRRGTGQERREASQEAGIQSATFVADWNPTLDGIRITDRIIYRGNYWDITDAAPDANREIQFTALRNVEGVPMPEPETPVETPLKPEWVSALEALATNPSDLLFAYNFAANEGWDGTEQELLDETMWQAPPTFGTWDVANIIDGLGLQPGNNTVGATPIGLIPAPAIADGATLVVAGKYYSTPAAPVMNVLFRIADQLDTFDGGIQIYSDLNYEFKFGNGGGGFGAVDNVALATTEFRSAENYLTDGSDIVGSGNGRANVTGPGSVVGTLPDSVYVGNTPLGSDVPFYITLVAVFALQPEANLPALSA